MIPDDAIGTFMYGLSLLAIDNDGLQYDKCADEDYMQSAPHPSWPTE